MDSSFFVASNNQTLMFFQIIYLGLTQWGCFGIE
jgi:hypothetical protein